MHFRLVITAKSEADPLEVQALGWGAGAALSVGIERIVVCEGS
jgi:hypothetical protein